MQAINTLKSNPAAFLGQRGIQLPQGMNDPNQILNQMLRSGRFSQAQVNQAYQQARQMFPSGAQNGSFVNNPKGNFNNGF
jgi:hypothetical protein